MAKNEKASGAVETPSERDELTELRENVAELRTLVENFLSKFGTYYNSQGEGAMFFVHRLVTSGANGVALTPHQGLVEHFGLPMRLSKPDDGEPCWVPEHIPQRAQELVELFETEEKVPVGAADKASG